jgi:galactonate dehydratase
MNHTTNGRRTFLTTCALAGAAAARPLAAFGQAVDNTKQASAPSALRITEVKCGYMRGSLFVKIHTNQGVWGCGEAVDAVQGTYHLVQNFGQRLRNQSPLNVHLTTSSPRRAMIGTSSGSRPEPAKPPMW